MKIIYKITGMICILGAALSCEGLGVFQGGDDLQGDFVVGEFGDQMRMSLNVTSPDPAVINTKGVDPDGAGIKDMVFFCFEEDGTFLKTVPGSLTFKAVGSEQGLVDVSIPNKTRIMHAICNLNMDTIAEDAFEGMKEDEVMNQIESASGLLLYWARIEVPSNVKSLYTDVQDADTRSEGEAVVDWLTIETNPVEKLHKGVAGKGNPIVLLRNQAKITVASVGADDPSEWNGEHFQVTGFTIYNSQTYGTVAPHHSEKGYPSYGSQSFNLSHWSADSYVCLPENREALTELVDVQERPEVYVFESANTTSAPVDVIVKGKNITDGVAEEELYYKAQILDPDRGLLPIRRNHHYKFHIVGKLHNGAPTFAEALAGPAANNIWLNIADEVMIVADEKFSLRINEHLVVRSAAEVADNNKLNLGFNIEALGEEPVDPEKIRCAWVEENQTVAEQEFQKTFNPGTGEGEIILSLNVPQANEVREGTLVISYGQLFRRITVKVTPEFEFTPVWASTEGIEGQQDHVTLIFNIPENYPNELFPFNVLMTTKDLTASGSNGQKLTIVTVGEMGYGERFRDIVDGKEVSHVGYKYVYRVTEPGMHRIYLQTFENQVLNDFQTFITIESDNFRRHHELVTLSNVNYESYLEPERHNILVAQKINVPVQINITALMDMHVDGQTEKVPTPVSISGTDRFYLYSGNLNYSSDENINYSPINQANWGTEGRTIEFYMPAGAADGKMSLNLFTGKPQSAEMIYISSAGTGTEFRSFTMDIENYEPFEFNASVNNTEFEYNPDQEIKVSFDVTSFTAEDGTDVDPFGTAFDIYIDAPALVLGNNPGYEGKIEEAGEGRFIYHVDADRSAEAAYGTDERKTIVFKPRQIAVTGDIVISADPALVAYVPQTISLADKPIVGTIRCGESEIAGHAVSFHNKSDNSRIISTTVKSDGTYALYIMNDKVKNWEGEPIIVFAQRQGDYYTAEIADLKTLATSPDIVLELQ